MYCICIYCYISNVKSNFIQFKLSFPPNMMILFIIFFSQKNTKLLLQYIFCNKMLFPYFLHFENFIFPRAKSLEVLMTFILEEKIIPNEIKKHSAPPVGEGESSIWIPELICFGYCLVYYWDWNGGGGGLMYGKKVS